VVPHRQVQVVAVDANAPDVTNHNRHVDHHLLILDFFACIQ